MAELELSFSVASNSGKFKSGTFLIDGLSILDTGDNYEVTYDDIDLLIDGKPYDGSITNWAGYAADAESLFDQVLNAYILRDGTFSSFSPEWKIFSDVDSLKHYEGDLLVSFPAYEYGELRTYNLDLATPINRYYQTDSGEVLMLDADNSVVTDMEHWYEIGLDEDITAILKGELECLYMGYNVKEMIKEAGGEEAWLEEYT